MTNSGNHRGIKYSVDFEELNNLTVALRGAEMLFPRSVLNGAMIDAAIPLKEEVRQQAPRGREDRGVHVSLRHRSSPGVANDYRRGGATKEDVRTKAVDPSGSETSRIVVGVSKQNGKVGWRTHLITRGTSYSDKHRFSTPANDFLQRAFDAKFNTVLAEISRFFEARTQAYLSGKRYRRQ